MPELPEVEGYRALAERGGPRPRHRGVDAPDAWYLKRGLVARPPDRRSRAGAAWRPGDEASSCCSTRASPSTSLDVVLGLHFGMSGRLIVDGQASVDRLLYATGGRRDPRTTASPFISRTVGGWPCGTLRRLGAVELDPDEDAPRSRRPDRDHCRTCAGPWRAAPWPSRPVSSTSPGWPASAT